MSTDESFASDTLIRFLLQAIAEKRRFSAEFPSVFPEVVEVLPLGLKASDSDPPQLMAFVQNRGVFSLSVALLTHIDGERVEHLAWEDEIDAFARALADETIVPEDFMSR